MIKRINHITFSVSDLKETTLFYEDILGLEKSGEWSNYVIFDVGGVELPSNPGARRDVKRLLRASSCLLTTSTMPMRN